MLVVTQDHYGSLGERLTFVMLVDLEMRGIVTTIQGKSAVRNGFVPKLVLGPRFEV